MYFKTIEFWGYKVTIACMPYTPIVELEKRAKKRIEYNREQGLNGFWLKESLTSAYGIEYWLKEQSKYVS